MEAFVWILFIVPGIFTHIMTTEKKQMSEMQQESEGRFRQLIETMNIGLGIFDEDFRFTFVNDMECEIYGYTREELIGTRVTDYLDDENREVVSNQIERRQQGEYTPYELTLIQKDGAKVTVLVSPWPPMYDSTGMFKGNVAMLTDITERKQIEVTLRKNEQQLRLISESVPASISYIDAEQRYLYCNINFTKFFLHQEKSVIGKHMWDVLGKKSYETTRRYIEEGLSGKSVKYEFELVTRHGDTRTFDVDYVPHIDSDDKIIGLYILSNDITERKRAEEKVLHMANHDELTGLPTLRLGKDRLSGAIALARRDKNNTALLFLDLDGFKGINDSLGHEAGDQVLIEVAKRLTQSVRGMDTVVRLGGDEFIIVLTQIEEKKFATKIAEKIIGALNYPFIIDGQNNNIGVSIGIALYPGHGDTPDELIKKADEAMYEVKRRGKNDYVMYENK